MQPIEQTSVNCQTFEAFLEREKKGLDATVQKWAEKAETFAPDQGKMGELQVRLHGMAANHVLHAIVNEGEDLVLIRKFTRSAINNIEEIMREKYPAKPSTFNPGPTLPAPYHGFIERLEDVAELKYGADLTIEDESGRRFAKAVQYDPKLLPGFDGDTRVYHCYKTLGCLPVGNLSQKLSGDTVKEIKEGNYTTCDYITSATTDVSPVYQKPIGAVAVGTEDPNVCKAIFLAE